MGIVNASPDSFSDGGVHATLAAQTDLAMRLLDEGADMVDVGGQSGITNVPEVAAATEIDRVVPLIASISARRPDAVISVDTYRPEVVAAALDAGASIVNDVSGLLDPEVAKQCAARDAALVLMHTRARPKERLQDPDRYDDVVADVVQFLAERLGVAKDQGLTDEALIVDPGIDFAKTPKQSIDVMRGLGRVRAFGRPVLLALSRKDFVGALTMRRPRERLAGTLAAIAFAGTGVGLLYRVHDVAAVIDHLRVLEALRGQIAVDPELALTEAIRHEPRP